MNSKNPSNHDSSPLQYDHRNTLNHPNYQQCDIDDHKDRNGHQMNFQYQEPGQGSHLTSNTTNHQAMYAINQGNTIKSEILENSSNPIHQGNQEIHEISPNHIPQPSMNHQNLISSYNNNNIAYYGLRNESGNESGINYPANHVNNLSPREYIVNTSGYNNSNPNSDPHIVDYSSNSVSSNAKKDVPFFNIPNYPLPPQVQSIDRMISEITIDNTSTSLLDTQQISPSIENQLTQNQNPQSNSNNIKGSKDHIHQQQVQSDVMGEENEKLSKDTSTPEPPRNDKITLETRFKMKRISPTKSVVLQNLNGPCPLLAILNGIILREKIVEGIHPELTSISLEEVLSIIANYTLTIVGETDENIARMVQDALTILPKMSKGLDVNIRFDGGFEFTEGLELFDLLNFKILHGWCIDPDDRRWKGFRSLTYNAAIEKLVTCIDLKSKSHLSKEEEEKLSEALTVELFLEENGGQLTEFGLARLTSCLRENEIAILFWNSHFSTIVNYKGKIYLLANDEGYLAEPEIAFLRLDGAKGNFAPCRSDFSPLFETKHETKSSDQPFIQSPQPKNPVHSKRMIPNQVQSQYNQNTSSSNLKNKNDCTVS